MKELILLCLFCALPNASVTTGAASERDTVFDNAILTARGPETGRGVVSVSATWWLELPMADLRWVYVTDPFQTELQLRTVGILNFGELHARFRLVEGAHFSFALRAGVHGMFGVFDEGDELDVAGGGGPSAGLMLSNGGESFQVTFVADARHAFVNGGSGWMSSSAVGVEFPLGHPLNGFFEVKLLTAFEGGDATHLPFFTHGISW